jgi:hypothetical protein
MAALGAVQGIGGAVPLKISPEVMGEGDAAAVAAAARFDALGAGGAAGRDGPEVVVTRDRGGGSWCAFRHVRVRQCRNSTSK